MKRRHGSFKACYNIPPDKSLDNSINKLSNLNELQFPKTWQQLEGEQKKKCTNGFKSGGNILGQSASNRKNKLFIIIFPKKN